MSPGRAIPRLAAALALVVLMAPASAASAATTTATPIVFTRFDSAVSFGLGQREGTQANGDALALTAGVSTGSWTSPDIDPGVSFTRLVSSWNAATPSDSQIEIDVQATTME